jgi:hypothetical protein
MGAREAAT